MTESALRHATWLAVCDGKKALLLENVGDRQYPKLQTRETYTQENPSAHDQGTDRPGRTIGSVGSRRGAVEQTDFHVLAERDFLRKFADRLDKSVGTHAIKALYLIAPARALGAIRPFLSHAVRNVIVGELDRDYVKLPLFEIEVHLKQR
jgi:protein required for attachment to host cells